MRGAIILKIILIALISYFTKAIVQIMIEWFNMIPLKVKAYTWGEFLKSKNFIWIDFIFHFWAYIILTISLYFLLKLVKLKKEVFFVLTIVLSFVFLLIEHNFQFPFYNHGANSLTIFNFKLIEQLVMYPLSIFTCFFLVENYLIISRK